MNQQKTHLETIGVSRCVDRFGLAWSDLALRFRSKRSYSAAIVASCFNASSIPSKSSRVHSSHSVALCLMIATLKALAASITSSGKLVKASNGFIACGFGAAGSSLSDSADDSLESDEDLLPGLGESWSPQSGPS